MANPNLATLTDEEILNLDPDELAGDEEEEAADEPGEDRDEAESAEDVGDTDNDSDEGGAEPEDDSEVDDEDGADSDSEEEPEVAGDEEEGTETDDEEEPEEANQASDDNDSAEEETTTSPDETDYKAELAKVLAPLKAAKRTITLDSVDQARRLMQMGVDYSRKMEALKPNMKVVKTLQKNDLLDIQKINNLIDLSNKNPEAIKKLLKDSNIDPMDLDLEGNSTYTPTNHAVSDREVDLEVVIDSMRNDPHFDKTVDVITNQWDMASKRILLEQPNVLQIIHEHIENGTYDQVADRVAREKLFGQHTGLSDLEAYKAVGDAMEAEGAFNVPTPQTNPPPSVGEATQDSQKPNQGSRQANRKARRKAASPTKGSAAARKKAPDLSKMSDEEIMKFDISSL
jgi:hypothetical protein